MDDPQLEQNLRRRRRVRWGIYLGVPGLILLCYLILWAWPLGPVELEIGPETTYLTEPLRDDGTVDYVAALNARGEEIPHGENAAAVLVRVIGFGDSEPEIARQFYDYF